MIKEFLMKQMLQSKLKNVSPEAKEKMMKMVDKNPDLFIEIASEIQEKVKGGMSEMDSAMLVMKNYQKELQELNSSI